MFPIKRPLSSLFILLCVLAACTAQNLVTAVPATTATVTQPLLSTSTPTSLPTPSSPRDSILWDDLQMTMDQLEITNEYVTDFGSTRTPPAGKKFLWVHIQLKNMGGVELNMPILENFSILYAAIEVKPVYGHRNGFVDYTTLGSTIFPDQELDGWLRFDIPSTAELKDMRFVFIPESAQVGTSYSSPSYPYADDKPTYVWDLDK
ncbi:MAG TPA: DUF4352 domain-containing protein [Anaerolineales bacterium]|nr:DUF4352 domain-containing protein [Anaerolineales bacterium]